MKKAIFMAALILALVWFDRAFMEQNAEVWYMPQPAGSVWVEAWINNRDVLLISQNYCDLENVDIRNEVTAFYRQSRGKPPELLVELEPGYYISGSYVWPLREGLLLDLQRGWRPEPWFYDEARQTMQPYSDAHWPERSELEGNGGFVTYWLAEGKYIIYRGLEGDTYSLSFYDAAAEEETFLTELQKPVDICLPAPGAYVNENAGPNRWFTMSIGGELVEVTLPEPGPGSAGKPRLRIWQAAAEWPLTQQSKSGYYWHFGLVPGDVYGRDLLWLEYTDWQKQSYQVVDLHTGELVADWEVDLNDVSFRQLLDVWGSKYYLAELPDYNGWTGMRIWACDYLTGEKEIIWQDNLTWWKQKLFRDHGIWADYIYEGKVSPDGGELVFSSNYDYVRRLPLN